jgi:hypothetical protein
MKKIIVATIATVAMFSVSVPAHSASVNVHTQHKDVSKKDKAKAKKFGINKHKVNRYHLKGWELRQIKKAKRWAKGSKPKSVRRCESGGNYRINTGNGYYGAYQFAAGTWNGVGGRRYSNYAHQAPKFAQDHMAWKLYQRSGWGPWSCA